MASKAGIGSRVSTFVIEQLTKRQEIVSKADGNGRTAYRLQANAPWIKLRSSVNEIDLDKLKSRGLTLDEVLLSKKDCIDLTATPTAAEAFILGGGTLSTDSAVRAGINRLGGSQDTRYSYSNFNGPDGLGYRPMPGIVDATIKSKNTYGTLVQAEVNFKVFSVEDLETIELLYFRPGYTALLEWGNSIFADNQGNIKQFGIDVDTIEDTKFFNPSNFNKMTELINARRETAEGNYDGLFGFITNFSFDLEKDGSYNCQVKIVSTGVILDGLKPTKTSDKTEEEEDDKKEIENRKNKSIYHYIFHYLREYANKKKKNEFSGLEALKEYKQNKVAGYLDDFKVFAYRSDIEGHYLGDQYDKTTPLMYIRLADIIMMFNYLNSWKHPQKDPGKKDPDFVLFNTDTEYTFDTFPDHFTVDPLVAFPPARPNGRSGDLNGRAASTNIFQSLGLQDVRSAGEVYSRVYIKAISSQMESHAKKNGGTDKINNIYVSTYMVEKSINDLLDGVQDSTVGVYNIIKDILSNTQAALGEVNDLDLFFNYTLNRYEIVDRNITPPDNLPVINISGLSSIVSNLSISSTISSNIASQIAIAAQGSSGNSKENVHAMMQWNRGAIDRHLEFKGTDDTEDGDDRAKSQGKYLKKLYNIYYKFNDGWGSNIAKWFTDQNYKAEDMESLRSEMMTDIQNLKKNYIVSSGGKVQGVVPVELSFDIDGIHGFIIGTTFKINRGILPSKYDNWAFIITGIEHKVNKNKWITSIKTQFFPDRSASAEARKNQQAAARGSVSNNITTQDENVGEDIEVTPNADRLRATLNSLGFSEKGDELSNGGDITAKAADVGIAVSKKINELYPDIKLTFTGGNDTFHQRLPYNSRHKRGTGLDFVISPNDQKSVNRVKKILQGYAAGNNPNFRFIDEYANPTKAASGKHFHISWGPGTESQAALEESIVLARKGIVKKYTV